MNFVLALNRQIQAEEAGAVSLSTQHCSGGNYREAAEDAFSGRSSDKILVSRIFVRFKMVPLVVCLAFGGDVRSSYAN